tara:strand:- start:31 stop:387 length:357 start_codon:yes stop_codon:yes gene_type:complete
LQEQIETDSELIVHPNQPQQAPVVPLPANTSSTRSSFSVVAFTDGSIRSSGAVEIARTIEREGLNDKVLSQGEGAEERQRAYTDVIAPMQAMVGITSHDVRRPLKDDHLSETSIATMM